MNQEDKTLTILSNDLSDINTYTVTLEAVDSGVYDSSTYFNDLDFIRDIGPQYIHSI